MGWVLHLKEAGFNVKTTDVPDVTPLKQEKGIPQRLFSCHTGLVDGYVIEGHVPAEDIRRLLDERPDVAGISVPGMPMGSPGMEGPKSLYREYPVISFTDEGELALYNTHMPQ